MLRLRPKERPSPDEILNHPAVLKRSGGENLIHLNYLSNDPLLNTIKFNPFNLHALKGKLPKASYDN